jgi:hypothetical protein
MNEEFKHIRYSSNTLRNKNKNCVFWVAKRKPKGMKTTNYTHSHKIILSLPYSSMQRIKSIKKHLEYLGGRQWVKKKKALGTQ